MPFAKTAATEKTSKTEFLTIHQIDRSGNVIEKSLTYTDELKPLADNLKDLNRSYIGSVKDGFVIVVSAAPTSYFVVRVDSKLNVTTQTIDVEWDESKFIDRKLSLPKFAINDDYFTIIQLKVVEDKIEATMNTMSLSDITNVTTTRNQLAFDDYAFHYNVGTDVNYSISEKQFVEHMREDWKGNTIYNYTTLGSYLDFNYVGDQLKCYGYYKNVNSSTEKVEKEGVLLYTLNPKEETVVEPNPIAVNGDENGSLRLGYFWGKEDEFVAVSLQRNYNFVLVSSLEEEKKIKGNVSTPQVFASFITGKEVNEKDELNAIAKIGIHYVGLKFQGIDDYFVKNGLGTSVRKVTIYEY
ncbi:MAG: hypothetical protein QE487_07265 [Fluviicola sp.]|nr:hypothetical protein [Fluviicola sp.]